MQKQLLYYLLGLLPVVLSSCGDLTGSMNLEGRRISDLTIRCTGPRCDDKKRISAIIRSQEGTMYSSDRIDSDVKLLYESGLVDDVTFSAESRGNEVRIVAQVSTRLPLGPSGGFIGNTAFSDLKLAKVTKLKGGQVATPKRITAAILRLKHFYRQQGYSKVSITSRPEPDGRFGIEDLYLIVVEGNRNPS